MYTFPYSVSVINILTADYNYKVRTTHPYLVRDSLLKC
jgi:hypothetical protein